MKRDLQLALLSCVLLQAGCGSRDKKSEGDTSRGPGPSSEQEPATTDAPPAPDAKAEFAAFVDAACACTTTACVEEEQKNWQERGTALAGDMSPEEADALAKEIEPLVERLTVCVEGIVKAEVGSDGDTELEKLEAMALGIPECDTYWRRLIRCEKLPEVARNGLRKSQEAWLNSREEARAAGELAAWEDATRKECLSYADGWEQTLAAQDC